MYLSSVYIFRVLFINNFNVQVHIHNNTFAREYERFFVGSPMLCDAEVEPNQEQITILTEQQVCRHKYLKYICRYLITMAYFINEYRFLGESCRLFDNRCSQIELNPEQVIILTEQNFANFQN